MSETLLLKWLLCTIYGMRSKILDLWCSDYHDRCILYCHESKGSTSGMTDIKFRYAVFSTIIGSRNGKRHSMLPNCVASVNHSFQFQPWFLRLVQDFCMKVSWDFDHKPWLQICAVLEWIKRGKPQDTARKYETHTRILSTSAQKICEGKESEKECSSQVNY